MKLYFDFEGCLLNVGIELGEPSGGCNTRNHREVPFFHLCLSTWRRHITRGGREFKERQRCKAIFQRQALIIHCWRLSPGCVSVAPRVVRYLRGLLYGRKLLNNPENTSRSPAIRFAPNSSRARQERVPRSVVCPTQSGGYDGKPYGPLLQLIQIPQVSHEHLQQTLSHSSFRRCVA